MGESREPRRARPDSSQRLAYLRLRVGEKRRRVDGEANAREQRACRRLPNDSGEVGEARHAGAALPIARLDPLK